MSYWRVFKNRFGMPSSVVSGLLRLCRETLEPLDGVSVQQTIRSLDEAEVSVELEDFVDLLCGKLNFNSISWLKFVMFLSYCNKSTKIMDWLLQFTPKNKKDSDNDLQHRVRNLADKLFFYLKRQAACRPEELNDRLGLLYRMTNQMHRLLCLHEALHHIFTRYSNIAVVHQAYSDLLKEVRELYEGWKETYKQYIKKICEDNVGFYLSEITQLMESGKKLHKDVRQFYFLTELLTADEQTQEMRVEPPKIVEIPEQCARKIADVRRKMKSFTMSGSAVMSSSMVGQSKMPRSLVQSACYVPLPKTVENQKDIESSSQSDEQGHV